VGSVECEVCRRWQPAKAEARIPVLRGWESASAFAGELADAERPESNGLRRNDGCGGRFGNHASDAGRAGKPPFRLPGCTAALAGRRGRFPCQRQGVVAGRRHPTSSFAGRGSPCRGVKARGDGGRARNRTATVPGIAGAHPGLARNVLMVRLGQQRAGRPEAGRRSRWSRGAPGTSRTAVPSVRVATGLREGP
jgi:hypothetical protein